MEPEKSKIVISYNDSNTRKQVVVNIALSTTYHDLLQFTRSQFALTDQQMMFSFHTLNGVFIPLHEHNFQYFMRDIQFNKLIRVQRVDPLSCSMVIQLKSEQNKHKTHEQLVNKLDLPAYSIKQQSVCSFLGDSLVSIIPFLEGMDIETDTKANHNISHNK